jgi:hypothetical protein
MPAKKPTRTTNAPAPHAAHIAALHERVCQILDIPTLADRNRDNLDFHSVGVATLREIIQIAFDAGAAAASGAPVPTTTSDPDDILATLKITNVERQRTGGTGTWVTGTIGGFAFEALVFPEHAEVASYELGQSRISKLFVRHLATRQIAANFDRGWDVQPTSERARVVVDLLAAGLAETVFGT